MNRESWTILLTGTLALMCVTALFGAAVFYKESLRHRQSEWMHGYEWGRREALDGRGWPTRPYYNAPRPSFTHLEKPDET